MIEQTKHCGGNETIVLASDVMGSGDDDLGGKLMVSFLNRLAQQSTLEGHAPGAMVCYNGGVQLLTSQSAAREALSSLENAGTEIVVCGTCVSFFGIGEDLAVGRVSDMTEIVTILRQAGTIIRP